VKKWIVGHGFNRADNSADNDHVGTGLVPVRKADNHEGCPYTLTDNLTKHVGTGLVPVRCENR